MRTEGYRGEARRKWGKTEAWQEFEKKEAASTGETADGDILAFFKAFGKLRGSDPAAEDAQAQVRALQAFITEHYYTCTDEILAGLGKLYTADERFRRNIDEAGGEGTAEFASRAIAAYCK